MNGLTYLTLHLSSLLSLAVAIFRKRCEMEFSVAIALSSGDIRHISPLLSGWILACYCE